MTYESIIGLEVHVQLKTKSKLFCSCANQSEGVEPNTNICPFCLGHPGTLPVLNSQAVEWAVLAAMALGCTVTEYSKFDRKNYFYPDLPKGYQISQYDRPIGRNGHLVVTVGDRRKEIRIHRLHLEEDAAKLLHPEGKAYSLVDFNRAGTPLLEIVSEPDFRSPEETKVYLQDLKLIMEYLGISDADMENGNLRCDANISLRPVGDKKLYPKTEVKNMNSFRSVERALAYEIERQRTLWEEKNPPRVQTTRGWVEDREITVEQREKEEAHDYRYFPEPDLPPLNFDDVKLRQIHEMLPELPDDKQERFRREYGISFSQSQILCSSREVADFFEATMTEIVAWVQTKENTAEVSQEKRDRFAKLATNWITTELFKLVKESNMPFQPLKMTPENMAEFIVMVDRNEINSSAAQIVLREMLEKGADPSQIVEEKNLSQLSDRGEIQEIVKKVVEENPKAVQNYRKGKTNALQFLVGQVMRKTKGRVDPKIAQEILDRQIKLG